MENTVILYKVPWTASSLNQPYFMSDTARDNYLNTLEHQTVLQNVNINFKTHLSLELKVAIDISVAETYNYAKIIYNNKNYFACIMDYEQISVNKTRLYLERHALSEQSNFLDLFQQFKISKCTLNNYKYGKLANINKQSFRVIRRELNPYTDFNLMLEYKNATGKITNYPSLTKNFYLVFIENDAFTFNPIGYNNILFGERTQYQLCLFSLDEITIKYKLLNSPEDQTIQDHTFTIPAITSAQLDAISPYIKSIFFTALPLGTDDDGNYYMPYEWAPNTFKSDITGAPSVFLTFHKETAEGYTALLNFSDKKKLFTSVELRCYSMDNSLTFDVSDFVNETGQIAVYFKYIFNINGTEIIGSISPSSTDDSIIGTLVKRFQFSLGDSTTYLLDSASSFDAENRYYDALTRNAVDKTKKLGAVQTATQMGAGVLQMGAGFFTGNLGQAAEGGANIIRGVGTILSTAVEIENYQKERALLASNERAKPDSIQTGGSSAVNIYSQAGLPYFIVEEPIDEDYNDFIGNVNYYGIDSNLFRSEIDLSEFIYNNHFFLKAFCIIKDNTFIEKPIYDDLYSLISGGCRYFIVNNA